MDSGWSDEDDECSTGGCTDEYGNLAEAAERLGATDGLGDLVEASERECGSDDSTGGLRNLRNVA